MLRTAAASNGGISEGINKIFSNVGIPGNPAIGGGNIPLPVVSAFHAHSNSGSNIAGEAHNLYGVGNTGKSTSTNAKTNKSTSTNTKCISNSPSGAKPHITKRGN